MRGMLSRSRLKEERYATVYVITNQTYGEMITRYAGQD